MTISTDTQAHQQAGGPPGRTGFGRLEAAGVALALAAGLAALALSSGSTYGPEDRPAHLQGSPYARPTAARHGQTLAAYIAAHEESRLPRSR